MQRSQTSTEYLIILAVVIIISLIVVGTLGGIPGIGGSAVESGSQAALATLPIGVSDLAFGSVGSKMTIKNNQKNTIEVTSVTLMSNGASYNKDLPVTLLPGESKQIESHSGTIFTDNRIEDTILINYTDKKTGATLTNVPPLYSFSEPITTGSVLRKDATYVFVTSGNYSADFGGIAGADAICESLAERAGLSGGNNAKDWVAWLSVDATNIFDRLQIGNLPITLINSTVIAYNRTDLTTSKSGDYLRAPIRLSEANIVIPASSYIATATTTAGNHYNWGFTDCTDFGVADGSNVAIGDPDVIDKDWTGSNGVSTSLRPCTDEMHLYCFENY